MNFSYFDQFQDIEIDLGPYISSISNGYTLSNRQPVKTKIKNLFTKYDLILNLRQNINFFEKYEIPEDELPEVTSFKKYQTTDFWWLVLVFNKIENPFLEWPLTQEQINKMADYLFETEGKYTRKTYYEFLFERNESKRSILLPLPTILNEIVWLYQSKLLEEQNVKSNS